jgi:glucose/mannose-6-phosphate isomerase
MYNKIKDFPKQISDTIDNTNSLSINSDYDKVVIVGMGGSAIAGLIVKDLLPQINIVIERNYIPNTAINQNTLVIVSSYSGNTEETLSYYHSAKELTNNIFGITSGGKLLEALKDDNKSYYILPEGYPPRSATGYPLTVLVRLLDSRLLEDISVDLLQSYSDKLSLEESTAHVLAKKIYPTIPIIVTEESTTSIGFRLKSQLNENSKMLSYNVTLPEMNHNEIVGWDSKLIDKNLFSLIWIDITWPANIKRMNITNKILKKKTSSSYHIEIPSDIKNELSGLFYLINYLDWLSYWCGHLNDVDIAAVKSIDILKKELA